MLLKSETPEISYLLLNTYILYRNLRLSTNSLFINIHDNRVNKYLYTEESINASRVIFCNEYKAFLSSLEMNGT